MENNSRENIDLAFLQEEDSEHLFGRLDYLLKDGIHIQNYGNQVEFYNYLIKNYAYLNQFYLKFNGVPLEKKGEGLHQYFFLDYHSKERSKILDSHKNTIKNEYIIMGFIIYKIIYFDGNVELNSVQELKQKITLDYEQYEEGLIRLIAKSSEGGKLSEDDVQIDKIVVRTLAQFKKLGWVDYRNNYFEPLPSFNRLLHIYEDVIKNIDNIIATYKWKNFHEYIV